MSLLVEDGTVVAGANSYVDLDEARQYAFDQGLSLPDSDVDAEANLVRAASYLDSLYGHRYQGMAVESGQSMKFPRVGVYLDGFLLTSTTIPATLKAAQIEAAIVLSGGVDLLPYGNAAQVKRERIGPLETEYETGGGASTFRPKATAVDLLMRPLLNSRGPTRVVRV